MCRALLHARTLLYWSSWIALDRSDVEKMGDEPFVCPPCKQAGKKAKKKAPPPKQQRRKKDDDDDKGGRRGGGRGGRGGGSDDDDDDDEGAGGDDPNDEDYVEGADVPGAVSYSITPVVAQERRPAPSMPLNPIRRKVRACLFSCSSMMTLFLLLAFLLISCVVSLRARVLGSGSLACIRALLLPVLGRPIVNRCSYFSFGVLH